MYSPLSSGLIATLLDHLAGWPGIDWPIDDAQTPARARSRDGGIAGIDGTTDAGGMQGIGGGSAGGTSAGGAGGGGNGRSAGHSGFSLAVLFVAVVSVALRSRRRTRR